MKAVGIYRHCSEGIISCPDLGDVVKMICGFSVSKEGLIKGNIFFKCCQEENSFFEIQM